MNTKTVLVVLYLCYLIVVTVRIGSMKQMNAEATTHLVVASLLGLLVLLTQKCSEGFDSQLNHKMSSLDGMSDKLTVSKNTSKNLPEQNDSSSKGLDNSAPVDYSMSSTVGKSNTIDPSHQSGMTGTRLDYRVSSYDAVKVEGTPDIETVKEEAKENTGKTYNSGAPTDYRMGPYSGVRLNTEALQKRRVLMPGFKKEMYLNEIESNCGDLKSPCNVPYQKPKFITPTGLETTPELSKQHNPSVDGKKDSKRSMFMFSHNVCHPGCCPSTYSCDHGCVCTNKDQREYLGRHGGMKKNK